MSIIVSGGVTIAIVAIVYYSAEEVLHRRFLKTLEVRLLKVVGTHQKALLLKRYQLVFEDAYGNVDATKWQREAQRFWSSTVIPQLNDKQRHFLKASDRKRLHLGLDILLSKFLPLEPSDRLSYQQSNPVEFEQHCAKLLIGSGWSAQTTQRSNDQGADVIAELAGTRLILQCKLYQRPVGNKAVQEASAARAHYLGHYAAVVSKSGFTSQARSLASTNSVDLLHPDELRNYANAIGVRTNEAIHLSNDLCGTKSKWYK